MDESGQSDQTIEDRGAGNLASEYDSDVDVLNDSFQNISIDGKFIKFCIIFTKLADLS
jgi:hypothetical protein